MESEHNRDVQAHGGGMTPGEKQGLRGLRVLAFESRRAPEMAKLIANYGGEAIVAPAMREAPLESNTEAAAFARSVADGRFDLVVFLTGVGTRLLARVAETVVSREKFIAALRECTLVARGPKPAAALKEMGLAPAITTPEPSTWRDLLAALDAWAGAAKLAAKRAAVQEYGASNQALLEGLRERGADVTPVPVYEWALPEDLRPLREAIAKLAARAVDVALVTSSAQVDHLLRVAAEAGGEERVRRGLARAVIGSIGPMTSDALRAHGITPDFEPEHPKMGFLVNEAARRARAILSRKRALPDAPQ